jgi:recombinational DNA repair protein RecT
MATNNETLPAEIKTITTMERNREKMEEAFATEQMQRSLLISAGDTFKSWDKDKQSDFMNRFAYEVCRDENLAPCFDSQAGKKSIVEALRRSLETGLQIGGKHAYLIPQPRNIGDKNKPVWITEARFSIRAEGYVALLCGGKKPIFQDIKWGIVYEEDDFSIDESEGTICHKHGMRRGGFLGCWVKIVKKNGESQCFSFDSTKINQWKSAGKSQGAIWNKWPEEMAEQACIRHACKRFEEAKDMLAEAWETENQALGEQSDDISERANSIMPDLSEIEDETNEPEEEIKNKVDKKEVKSEKKGYKNEEHGDETIPQDLF